MTKLAVWLCINRRFKGATDTISSHIRFVDDTITQSLSSGIHQIVFLGAGYDARSYRLDFLSDKHIFEVDHPDTQKRRRSIVKSVFGTLPKHVTYVSVDFEKSSFMQALLRSGYDPSIKTLFIWEGVTKYFTESAVNDVLKAVVENACSGSAIVFDYLFESMINRGHQSELTDKMLNYHPV